MRLTLRPNPLVSRESRARLREAARRGLPYALLALAMSFYVLIALAQGWI